MGGKFRQFYGKKITYYRNLEFTVQQCDRIINVPNNIKTHYRHIHLFIIYMKLFAFSYLASYYNYLGWLWMCALFPNQGLVNVWNYTTTCNGCFNQAVQFFITTDGKLQVTRSDSLHFQIFTGISCQLQHLRKKKHQNAIML